MNNLVINYFLWFVVVMTLIMYGYTAMKNSKMVDIVFMGTTKKISMRKLLLITMLDGLVIGMIAYYLISTSL